MSNLLLFADNASSTLASGISNSATSLTVAASTGTAFSAPGAGQYALGTLEDVSGNIEVVQITSRTGDNFTIVRAQEGTTALSFASGTRFEQRVTAGMLAVFLQKTGGDTLSGTTTVSGVLNLGSGGSIRLGEIAGTAIRSQPGDTSNQILVPIGSPPTAGGSVILTSSNLASNMPGGYGLVQTGMILLWYGTLGSIPTGFVPCNGSNATPDLRDQFVLGAGGALATSGGTAVTTTASSLAYPTGAVSGSYMLVATDIPAHNHPVQWTQVGVGGGSTYGVPQGAGFASAGSSNGTTGMSGAATTSHTHTIPADAGHTHAYYLPPYKALYYIMKT